MRMPKACSPHTYVTANAGLRGLNLVWVEVGGARAQLLSECYVSLGRVMMELERVFAPNGPVRREDGPTYFTGMRTSRVRKDKSVRTTYRKAMSYEASSAHRSSKPRKRRINRWLVLLHMGGVCERTSFGYFGSSEKFYHFVIETAGGIDTPTPFSTANVCEMG